MSYANATKSGTYTRTGNTTRENSYGKYFNENLLVTDSSDFTCEDVVDEIKS